MESNARMNSSATLLQTRRLNSSTGGGSSNEPFNYRDFYTGLTLALLSSFFIGSSFILKKKGLLKLCNVSAPPASPGAHSSSKKLRAGQGGYGYLKEWLWWSGLITMGVGETCNFAAYGFVPATLVTPLGALSVLISAVMSAYFLNEKLNAIGKIGCILTAIGSTIMVIHAPKEGEVKSVNELLIRLQDPEFICFTILSTVCLLGLIIYYVPRYGNTNVLVYILICSILGSFTVMACKGLSLGIKEMVAHRPSVSYLYTLMFVLIAVGCIVVQMNYLNRALDIFNTAIVTTVYYVLFTLFVMIASALLFKELLNVSFQDFVGCMCGFSTSVCALCLIHFFKTSAGNSDDDNLFDKFATLSRAKRGGGGGGIGDKSAAATTAHANDADGNYLSEYTMNLETTAAYGLIQNLNKIQLNDDEDDDNTDNEENDNASQTAVYDATKSRSFESSVASGQKAYNFAAVSPRQQQQLMQASPHRMHTTGATTESRLFAHSSSSSPGGPAMSSKRPQVQQQQQQQQQRHSDVNGVESAGSKSSFLKRLTTGNHDFYNLSKKYLKQLTNAKHDYNIVMTNDESDLLGARIDGQDDDERDSSNNNGNVTYRVDAAAVDRTGLRAATDDDDADGVVGLPTGGVGENSLGKRYMTLKTPLNGSSSGGNGGAQANNRIRKSVVKPSRQVNTQRLDEELFQEEKDADNLNSSLITLRS